LSVFQYYRHSLLLSRVEQTGYARLAFAATALTEAGIGRFLVGGLDFAVAHEVEVGGAAVPDDLLDDDLAGLVADFHAVGARGRVLVVLEPTDDGHAVTLVESFRCRGCSGPEKDTVVPIGFLLSFILHVYPVLTGGNYHVADWCAVARLV